MVNLIDKDKVVAEIQERINNFVEQSKIYPEVDLINSAVALYGIIAFIDELDMKEVDLDSELILRINELPDKACYDDLANFAKHFFELGLADSNKNEEK